jgi:hypothetical protein
MQAAVAVVLIAVLVEPVVQVAVALVNLLMVVQEIQEQMVLGGGGGGRRWHYCTAALNGGQGR